MPDTFFTPALARDISAELVTPLGYEATAAALADLAPDRLLKALADLDRRMPTLHRWGRLAHSLTPLSPVVDGEVLPTDPWTGLAAGASREIPLLVGHNRDEARLFLALSGHLDTITDQTATTAMELFGPEPDPAARTRAAYPDAGPEDLLVLTHSDRTFRRPSLQLAPHTPQAGATTTSTNSPGPPSHPPDHGRPATPSTSPRFRSPGSRPGHPTPRHPSPTRSPRTLHTDADRLDRLRPHGQPGWHAHNDHHHWTRVLDTARHGGIQAYPEETSRQLWADSPVSPLDLQDSTPRQR